MKKVKKPKQKGTKADSIEKLTVAELLPQLESTEFKPHDQPYASLFEIYKREFLDVSVSKELIHKDSLAIAGDGTPVVTSHRERKKRICKCKENGITDCNCDRYFSNRIVISDGIHPVTVFIMDTICICLSTLKLTFQYFFIIPVHPDMIRMDFCMIFSG